MICFTAIYCLTGAFMTLPNRTPELMLAIAQVESNFNPKAIGDNGDARGIFQIHEAYWKDGAEYLGVDWDYMTHVWDIDKSAQIVLAYWQRYGAFYTQKTGKPMTLRIMSMLHNGGVYGWCPSNTRRYTNTTRYWNKVEKVLEDQTNNRKDKK